MPTLSERADAHHRTLLALLLLASGTLVWWRRFLLDDAYISLRYARNWVAGHGLVWNPGEAVEGYTNFLWTVLLALPLSLGLSPETFVFVLGPLLGVATLLLTDAAGRTLLGSRPAALVAVLLVGSNFSFCAYATGGLETGLVTALVTGIYAVSLGPLRDGQLTPGRAVLLSFLAAAAALARLDSVMAWAPALALVGARVYSSGDRDRGRVLACLVAPGALVLGVWLGWKLHFYGALLPNTFAAKTGSAGAWPRGARYLWTFLASYWLLPGVLLVAAALPRLWRQGLWRQGDKQKGRADLAALVLGLAASWIYVVSVGGDFMEFRFLVPTLPLLALLGVWATRELVPWPAARWGLLALVIAGSVHHATSFERRGGIESVPELAAHLTAPHTDWIGVGRALRAGLPAGSDVTLAVTTAGAIPYFAGLESLDMLGLTDPWVARNGIEIDALAGHTRIAPFRRLAEREINLVIGLPWVLAPGAPDREVYRFDELSRLYLVDAAPRLLPLDAAMVEVPLSGGRRLAALYLHPHPDVEAAIAGTGEGAWRRVPLRVPRR